MIFKLPLSLFCVLSTSQVAATTDGVLKTNFGLSYDSFFAGPGLKYPLNPPPGFTGTPSDSGLNFFNYTSIKIKISSSYAIDLQLRNQLIVTHAFEYRHQGQRLGVSGTLLHGRHWAIRGAINTDVPIPLIMGQIASERTLIFNPGLFASFTWEPQLSRWSLFIFMTLRIWFYRDPHPLSSQDRLSGGRMNKPQYDLHANPSVNYLISNQLSWRLGVTVEVLKNMGWDGPRRTYMPIDTGMTWQVNPQMEIYTYVMTSTPLDDELRKYQLETDSPAHWLQTASLNVWISGHVF